MTCMYTNTHYIRTYTHTYLATTCTHQPTSSGKWTTSKVAARSGMTPLASERTRPAVNIRQMRRGLLLTRLTMKGLPCTCRRGQQYTQPIRGRCGMCATYVVVNCKVGELHRHGDQKNGTIDNAFFKLLFQVHKLFQSINRKGYLCPQTHHTARCRCKL